MLTGVAVNSTPVVALAVKVTLPVAPALSRAGTATVLPSEKVGGGPAQPEPAAACAAVGGPFPRVVARISVHHAVHGFRRGLTVRGVFLRGVTVTVPATFVPAAGGGPAEAAALWESVSAYRPR
jgi:hypothetical protein